MSLDKSKEVQENLHKLIKRPDFQLKITLTYAYSIQQTLRGHNCELYRVSLNMTFVGKAPQVAQGKKVEKKDTDITESQKYFTKWYT